MRLNVKPQSGVEGLKDSWKLECPSLGHKTKERVGYPVWDMYGVGNRSGLSLKFPYNKECV